MHFLADFCSKTLQIVVSKVAPVKWAVLFGGLAAKVASFRDALTRIMLNFEAITALKGQTIENAIVTGRYDLAVAQMKKNHLKVARHGFTMSFMYQHWLGTIIGAVVILPGVFREKKSMETLAEIAEVRGVVGHQYMMVIAVLGAAWGAVQSMTTLKQVRHSANIRLFSTHFSPFLDSFLDRIWAALRQRGPRGGALHPDEGAA